MNIYRVLKTTYSTAINLIVKITWEISLKYSSQFPENIFQSSLNQSLGIILFRRVKSNKVKCGRPLIPATQCAAMEEHAYNP